MARTTLQRIALFGGPIGYIALGLVHPNPDPTIGDDAGFFILLHLVQPALIALMAYALWTLVEGLPGLAARITRVALVPYVLAYTMFDSVIGVAKGVIVEESATLSAADQAVVKGALEGDHWVGYVLYLSASLSWLAAVVALAVAVSRNAPLRVSLLLGIGGLIFAVMHPQPLGPIGMTLFLAGVVLHERRRQTRDAVQALPALQP